MNQQERKYIAKRVTQEEEAAIQRINETPWDTPDPKTAYAEALKKVSADTIIEAVNNEWDRRTKKDQLKAVSPGYPSTMGQWTGNKYEQVPIEGTDNNGKVKIELKISASRFGESMPSYAQLLADRKIESAAKAKHTRIVREKAVECRDKALLGDGSEALAALHTFLEEIKTIAA